MELFPLNSRRKIVVRVIPRFPARVNGISGVSVERSAGTYDFALDFASLTPIAALEDDDKFVVERADGSFAYIENLDMPTHGINFRVVDQATYDALSPPDPTTLYIIIN